VILPCIYTLRSSETMLALGVTARKEHVRSDWGKDGFVLMDREACVGLPGST